MSIQLEPGMWRRVAMTAGLAVLGVTAPWWGRHALGSLAFFRVRAVEVYGSRYTSPADVVDRLHVDTTASVWDDLDPLAARARTLPGVRTATVGRKLPGTLVVHIVERTPLALAPAAGGGMRVYDAAGTVLPIDPTRVDLDLPIVARADRASLGVLAAVRDQAPSLYAQISEVRRTPAGDFILQLPTLRVLAPPDIAPRRLATIPLVTADLARRHARARELDLRYRDQVVARLL
jgi:cell division protein FtsQ